MFNKVSVFVVLVAFISMFSSVSKAATSCASTPGFTCSEKCPAANVGKKFEPLDCRCQKQKTPEMCVPTGTCSEYTTAGVPTGVSDACLCDKYSTSTVFDSVNSVKSVKIGTEISQ